MTIWWVWSFIYLLISLYYRLSFRLFHWLELDHYAGFSNNKMLLLLLMLPLRLIPPPAANCPGPQGTGNIVLTSEALLLNHFPEDSQVTVECANGYIEESGSGVIKCIGGKWTEPDLICKSESCQTFITTLLTPLKHLSTVFNCWAPNSFILSFWTWIFVS